MDSEIPPEKKAELFNESEKEIGEKFPNVKYELRKPLIMGMLRRKMTEFYLSNG